VPGGVDVDGRAPTVAELLVRSTALIRDFCRSLDVTSTAGPSLSVARRGPPASNLAALVVPAALAVVEQLLVLAGRGASGLVGPRGGAAVDRAFAPLLTRLGPAARTNPAARRLHDLVDLVRTVIVGMAADGLADEQEAYDAVDHLDFRDWLTRHGARRTTLDSAIVRGQYDLVFSHQDGDPARPRFAAGWGAFLSSKLWFDYKGAIFWKMRAGMGDVVFVPLHQALSARGVDVRCGQTVEELVPADDGTAITNVVIATGGFDRDGGTDRRLSRVRGLPCYVPHAAAPVRAAGEGVRRELKVGEDFDALVLAVPPAAARAACRRLAAQRSAWQRQLDGLGSVATHSFQVWLRPTERSLGWPHPGVTMSGFAKPFDTWSSMSHLIDAEDWPDEERPSTLGYFCSTTPTVDGGDQDVAHRRTRDLAVGFLEHHARYFWPASVDRATGRFDWELLCADGDARGRERFDSQYWTANVAPSARYVQTLPGTNASRLRPDASGYANLALAGDWTDSGINAGCIEAAVVSGLQAANSLLGRPRWDGISGVFLR
jgi:hypothetical protein